jgi:hypothetical protein
MPPKPTPSGPGEPAAKPDPRERIRKTVRARRLRQQIGLGVGVFIIGAAVVGLMTFQPWNKPAVEPGPASIEAKAPVEDEEARNNLLKDEWFKAKDALREAQKNPEVRPLVEKMLQRLAVQGKGTEYGKFALDSLETLKTWVSEGTLEEKYLAGVRSAIDNDEFLKASSLIKNAPAAAGLDLQLKRLREELVGRAAVRYEEIVRGARALAAEKKLEEARALLTQSTGWDLPEFAERALKEMDAISAGAPAATAQVPEPPAEEKKDEATSKAGKTEPAPAEKPKGRLPRAGAFKPGGTPEAEREKKYKELGARVKAEIKGAKKTAEQKRAEWLGRLEKEFGIYDVATMTDNGDVARRVDIVIVTSGFPKADAKKVVQFCDGLKAGLLKAEPFRNYPDYVNFHRICVDDPDKGAQRIPYRVENRILTCDVGKAIEYARKAPDVDLVVTLCNVSGVRATGGGGVITIDADLDMGRTFLHEMGHAFAQLRDEYVEQGGAAVRPLGEDEFAPWMVNVTKESNPKLVKWHYWIPPEWWAPHEINRLPPGHKVGCFEGGALVAQGVWRPEEQCLMRTGDRYCVVCFEEVERRFYRLIAPIDDARPRRVSLGLWIDETATLEADAINTDPSAKEQIGKFEGFWYVDGRYTHGRAKNLTTALAVQARSLGAGTHEVGLRVDFSNKRVRRDEGWLSSSRGWRIDVSRHAKPKLEGPARVEAKVGEPVAFEVKLENPDPAKFRLVFHDFPDGATFENGTFRWTPTKAFQGAWRPRFVVTDGLRSAEKAVEIAVLDPKERNFPPIVDPMPAASADEGELLELALDVTDVDGDTMVFTSPNLPEGAVLDAVEGVIRWKPGPSQAGRYAGILFEVFDGRHRAKGSLEIVVDNMPSQEGSDFDILNSLRSARAATRSAALGRLADYPWVFAFFESSRLMRDRDAGVRSAAVDAVKRLAADADATRTEMMIKDLAPHAWHFTDDPAALAWLGELAQKGREAVTETKQLRASLRMIEKYNKDRAVAK